MGSAGALSQTLISNSSAITHGGGIYAAGGVLLLSRAELDNNTAQSGEGGAICVVGAVRDSADSAAVGLVGNQAQGHGGAIRAFGDVRLLNHPLLQNNQTLGADADGGAIDAGGSVTAGGGVAVGNHAAHGGVVYALGSVTLDQNNLSPNSASLEGGCIFAGGSVTIQDVFATSCSAGGTGGAIYASGDVRLSGHGSQNFSGNQAGGDGGAVFAGGALTLDNLQLSDNTAGGSGGAGAATWVTVTGATISGNVALAWAAACR